MKKSELEQLRKQTSTTTTGKYALNKLSAEEKMERIFGGRIRGDERRSLSRMNVGEPRMIAGVMVPDKPLEPDNCCMSGCINCVWEMYNDDVKDWNVKRKKAAVLLRKKGGVWPSNFHPPVQLLKLENLEAGTVVETDKKIKDDDDTWGTVPVQIRVFAEMEKRMKERKRQSRQEA